MKRARMLGAIVFSLIAGSSAVAHAQSRGQGKPAERRQKQDDNDKSDAPVSARDQQQYAAELREQQQRLATQRDYSRNYVDQSDYNYYLRKGFRRGHADGFNSRSQHGTSSTGGPTILSSLHDTILSLQSNR
jgi:flagellar biosynthesis/type III secretory pathway protein FliH